MTGKLSKLDELAMWMSVEAVGISLDRSIAQGIISLAGAGPVRATHVEQALAFARDAGLANLDELRTIGDLILRFEASRGATYEGTLPDVATTPRTVTGHDDIAVLALDEPPPEPPNTLDPDADTGPALELARGTGESLPTHRIERPDDIPSDAALETLALAPDAIDSQPAGTTLPPDAPVSGVIPTVSLKPATGSIPTVDSAETTGPVAPSSAPATVRVPAPDVAPVTGTIPTVSLTPATAAANARAIRRPRRSLLVACGVVAIAAAAVVTLSRTTTDTNTSTATATAATEPSVANDPAAPTTALRLGDVELRAPEGWHAGADIAYRGDPSSPDESMFVTTAPAPAELASSSVEPAALLAATRTATRGVAARLSRDGARFELAGCGLLPGKTAGTCRGVASIAGASVAIDTYLRVVDGKAIVAIVEARAPRATAHREAAAMFASLTLVAH